MLKGNKNMMKTKRGGKTNVFQFSNIRDTDNIKKIKTIFDSYNVKYDESKYYSPNATHLIIDKIDTSEKMLCFIAAGKWILRHSYLRDSFSVKEWLDESQYHISSKFKESKLALLSLKWREKIMKEKVYPFSKWNILCMVSNREVCDAMIRIVEAGQGRGVAFYTRKYSIDMVNSSDRFTLVIYDSKNQEIGGTVAKKLSIPYYPYQCIVDYLLQCEYSPKPTIPLNFYSVKKIGDVNDSLVTEDESTDDCKVAKHILLSSYRIYALSANKETNHEFINTDFSNKFDILWSSNCFAEAMDMLDILKTNENLYPQHIHLLYKYILNGNANPKQNFLSNKNSAEASIYLYNRVLNYLTTQLIENPPIEAKMKRYYKKIYELQYFNVLEDFLSKDSVFGIVDVLFILSIHDFLLLNLSGSETKLRECALLYSKINISLYRKLYEHLSTQKTYQSLRSLQKLFQVISFAFFYLDQKELSVFLDKKDDNMIKLVKVSDFFTLPVNFSEHFY